MTISALKVALYNERQKEKIKAWGGNNIEKPREMWVGT